MNFCYLFGVCLIFAFVSCRSDDDFLNMDEDGYCQETCPEGTYVYISSCDTITMSQLTCRQPKAERLGYLCDYTRCDCLDQKYWDEAAKKCVLLEECSDQSTVSTDE